MRMNSPLLQTFVLLTALATTLSACSPGTEATSTRMAATTAPLSTPTRVGQTSSPAPTASVLAQVRDTPTSSAQAASTPSPASPQVTSAPSQGKISPIDGATMVYVPANTYTWGIYEKRQSASWIDKYEVTNGRFKKFMDAGGYTNSAYWSQTGWKWLQSKGITQPLYWNDKRYNTPQQPVVGVSWYEADAYARWAGKRLPTTLEWQAAAQGTDNRIWPWGSVWDPAKANAGDGSRGAPVAVGSYPSGVSPFGALDMAGNVWEYTADWYMLRPSNDQRYCATLSSTWDSSFGQDQFCEERRSRTFGRYPSGGFRTAASDLP